MLTLLRSFFFFILSEIPKRLLTPFTQQHFFFFETNKVISSFGLQSTQQQHFPGPKIVVFENNPRVGKSENCMDAKNGRDSSSRLAG